MEYSQKLKFMDTYITQGNGGMVIGANESTTKVVVTPDRISFQSGGSEVAYISQRMLHIDNGVFTMSLQLGHYITRAHPRTSMSMRHTLLNNVKEDLWQQLLLVDNRTVYVA